MGPAIYSDVACVGHENSLQDCNKNVYPDFFCTSNQIAGALCTSVCKDGDVRLVGGSNSQEGTVEICFNNIWGMVSDLNWGDLDALVVCRQLYLGTDGELSYIVELIVFILSESYKCNAMQCNVK